MRLLKELMVKTLKFGKFMQKLSYYTQFGAKFIYFYSLID